MSTRRHDALVRSLDVAGTRRGASSISSSGFPSLRRSGATLFDAYVSCDWSASSTPRSGTDSLWLCRARYATSGVLAWALENPRTRREATEILRAWLVEGVAANERTLAGFDFSFGLPDRAYSRLGVAGWRSYWEHLRACITEGPRNENNRFDVARALNRRAALAGGGPFWGVPPAAADEHLRATKPPADAAIPEYRIVETTLRAQKHRPFSAWQLLGNGSVGGQILVGVPVLERLRTDPALAAHTRVWPFETATALVVFAEAWPNLVDVDLARHPVRDAAQMIALGAWAATEDLAGRLSAHLAAPEREPRARTEGWVLGVP